MTDVPECRGGRGKVPASAVARLWPSGPGFARARMAGEGPNQGLAALFSRTFTLSEKRGRCQCAGAKPVGLGDSFFTREDTQKGVKVFSGFSCSKTSRSNPFQRWEEGISSNMLELAGLMRV